MRRVVAKSSPEGGRSWVAEALVEGPDEALAQFEVSWGEAGPVADLQPQSLRYKAVRFLQVIEGGRR